MNVNEESHGKADVVIIGGGLVGCSIGYHLAKQGVDVLLLEKVHPGYGASTRSAAGIAMCGIAVEAAELAALTAQRWQVLEQEFNTDLEFFRDGDFEFAVTEDQDEDERRAIREKRQAGMQVEYLTPSEVREMVPLAEGPFRSAGYCPLGGHADAIKTTVAYAKAAREAGVRILSEAEVVRFDTDGGRVRQVVCADGRVFSGNLFVNCGGAWAVELMKMVGRKVAITPRRATMTITYPTKPLFTHFLRGVPYGTVRQDARGRIHIGSRSFELNPAYNQLPSIDGLGRVAMGMANIVPCVRDLPVLRCWGGITNFTPDKIPIMDWVPGYSNLYLCSGMSGLGFTLSPGVGVAVAEVLTKGRARISMEPYRIDRFDR